MERGQGRGTSEGARQEGMTETAVSETKWL